MAGSLWASGQAGMSRNIGHMAMSIQMRRSACGNSTKLFRSFLPCGKSKRSFLRASITRSVVLNQPKGVQQPHIPLLIGGSGEQVTLKLVAQYADVCNVSGDITKIQRKLAILKHHCERVSRDYNSIKRTAIVDTCAIAPTEEAAIAKLTPH